MLFISILPVAAASSFELTLHLHAHASHAALDAKFWAVATPSSPTYGQFLSIDALGEFIGGTTAAVESASSWLGQLGGRNVSVSALRDRVTAAFDGSEPGRRPDVWTARGLPQRSLQPS